MTATQAPPEPSTDSERSGPPEQSELAQPVQRAGGGPAMPTWLVLASLAVAVLAALAFFITGSPDRAVQATDAPGASPQALESGPALMPAKEPGRGDGRGGEGRRGDGRRGDARAGASARIARVDIFNNSGQSALATTTGSDVRALGWTVVTEDDWYGEIPRSTVYYPAALADDAKRLAKDLGLDRVRPAVSPMSFERLTVILTG